MKVYWVGKTLWFLLSHSEVVGPLMERQCGEANWAAEKLRAESDPRAGNLVQEVAVARRTLTLGDRKAAKT